MSRSTTSKTTNARLSPDADALAFTLTTAPIDWAALRRKVEDPAAGAFVAFEGWVRNHNEGEAVTGLHYEVYPELALRVGHEILVEARERFGALAIRAEHAHGELTIGDMAVWVGVSAAHRDAAFGACRYVIDELKKRVPIWKQERYQAGDARFLSGTPLRG